jgi:hypothetical protein
MHNPRIRIPAKSPRQILYRSWNGENPPVTSASKPLCDEVQRLSLIVSECSNQNARLRATLTAFADLGTSGSSAFLLDQFQDDVNLLAQRIYDRSSILNDLHKELTAKKEELLVPVDNRAEKKQLLKENQQLVTRALYLEKQMISSKLRLRLNHDHREFCALKRQFERLTSPDAVVSDEDVEIQRNKVRIKNLKRGIEHETQRLIRLAVPATVEVDAAELIQRVWRGFLARKRLDWSSMKPVVDVEEQQLVTEGDEIVGGIGEEQLVAEAEAMLVDIGKQDTVTGSENVKEHGQTEEFPELAHSDGEEASPPTELPPPDDEAGEVLA